MVCVMFFGFSGCLTWIVLFVLIALVILFGLVVVVWLGLGVDLCLRSFGCLWFVDLFVVICVWFVVCGFDSVDGLGYYVFYC